MPIAYMLVSWQSNRNQNLDLKTWPLVIANTNTDVAVTKKRIEFPFSLIDNWFKCWKSEIVIVIKCSLCWYLLYSMVKVRFDQK